MARKIDFSKPLSADEREYVLQRPWLIQDAELQGLQVSFEDDEFTLADPDDEFEPENPETQEPEGDGGSEGEDDEEAEEEVEEVAPYEEWDYADLKAEAKERGLTATGSKEQLIERLRESDSAE